MKETTYKRGLDAKSDLQVTDAVTPEQMVELDKFAEALRKYLQKKITRSPVKVIDSIVEIPILKEPLVGFQACPGFYYGGLIVATLRLSNGQSAVGFAVASPNDEKPNVSEGIRIALIRARIAYRATFCGINYGSKMGRIIISSDGSATLGPKHISDEMMERVSKCLVSMRRCNL